VAATVAALPAPASDAVGEPAADVIVVADVVEGAEIAGVADSDDVLDDDASADDDDDEDDDVPPEAPTLVASPPGSNER
jgi:phosphopantothenoylcysteine synthetase/decarboxylase